MVVALANAPAIVKWHTDRNRLACLYQAGASFGPWDGQGHMGLPEIIMRGFNRTAVMCATLIWCPP